MIKETPFCRIHKALNAKMVEFAGFLMPIEYSGIKDEHFAVRQSAGIFDVSHMGEFWIKGPQALELIQKTTTNNAAILKPGQIQYSCFPNGKGGIVDDLLVYAFDAEKFLLVVNAANTEKDLKWLQQNNQCGAVIENDSDNLAQLAIQGPNAINILQKLTNIQLDQIPYYQFTTGDFAGTSNVIISATGYTGAGGFEIYFDNKQAEKVWHSIMDAGQEFGLKPAGLGARDTLRLEMGYCLYGNDIDDTTSPIEAGLGWITKFADNKPFIDRELLENQKKEGITRRLYGFKMIDKGIARHGYEICNENDEVIGTVTSGTISPVLNVGIGMGYIQQAHATISKNIYIKIRGKSLKAEIVKTPFI